jgi:hypothetical protein
MIVSSPISITPNIENQGSLQVYKSNRNKGVNVVILWCSQFLRETVRGTQHQQLFLDNKE